MSALAQLRSWWNALIHRRLTDNSIEEELRFHIEAHTQQLIADGIPPAEAARRAKASLGNPTTQKEIYRSAIGLQPLHEIGGDIRYGLRSLLKNPGISLVAILSLALGIGATTAMFSLIYATLLHPFPYADADRIVNPAVVDELHPQIPTWFALTSTQYDTFRQAKSIDQVMGFNLGSLETTDSDLPEDVRAAYVTPNASAFLGIPAMIGRGLQSFDSDHKATPANLIVLDYHYWTSRYNSDPQAVGKVIQLDHENYTIVGVMPRRFSFSQTVGIADVYIPRQ